MRLVVIESPYAGQVQTNLSYVRACMADCLARGEAPYASHALYTQRGVLDDDDLDERRHGIEAGLAWGEVADAVAVYVDLGVSSGMEFGIRRHIAAGRPVEFRTLGGQWSSPAGRRDMMHGKCERILAAAVWVDTGEPILPRGRVSSWTYPLTGIVFAGFRHAECIFAARVWAQGVEGGPALTVDHEVQCRFSGAVFQGFITSTGRYVDRHEAWKIADAAGQIRLCTGSVGTLYSEDIY